MKLEVSQISLVYYPPYNLSSSERKALQELKCDTDLMIDKADKGSTIVVQSRADYIKDASHHLDDPA